jgi:CRISPR type IV-associated protein Csf1
MKPISPSQIVIKAAGRPPISVLRAKEPGVCAMCGYPHSVDDPINPFSPIDSFTDYQALKAKTSKVVCGWCTATWNADFTQKALKTVSCEDGVFAAASNADIAYWIANPPKGRWVWVMGDQKRQHIVWRATVNTSTEIFQVQMGETNMTIRPAKVKLVVKRVGAALKSPFAKLTRDLDDAAHGHIRQSLHTMAETDPDVKNDIALIQSCTPGELWALTSVLYAAPNPERPQKYFP